MPDADLVETRELADEAAIAEALDRIAREIVATLGVRDLCLVGIHTGGVPLAERLRARIAAASGTQPPLGAVDITLYRDDVFEGMPRPLIGPTRIEFPLRGKAVVLVDDVLYTGRTVRAALDALMELGRPRVVQLAVLVDRGCRELPIQADYVGLRVQTGRDESVKVMLREKDGADRVALRRRRP